MLPKMSATPKKAEASFQPKVAKCGKATGQKSTSLYYLTVPQGNNGPAQKGAKLQATTTTTLAQPALACSLPVSVDSTAILQDI